MKFSIKKICLEKDRSSCLIIGVFELHQLSYIGEKIDKFSEGYISKLLLDRKELEGKIGQMLLLHDVPNILSERVLLIGCGKQNDLNERQYKKIIHNMINILKTTPSTSVISFLTELNVKNRNIYWKIRHAIETIIDSLYSFEKFKKNSINISKNCLLKQMIFHLSRSQDLSIGEKAIQHGVAISNGIKITKDLANMPPNICNSIYLSSQVTKLSKYNKNKIVTEIIDEKEMKKIGMNAYLAVGKGSTNRSLISIIHYKGHTNSKKSPIVLIGKGLTFDTGGISIKSSNKLDEMKYDMCGAATVYGVLSMAIELNLSINIIGILACCENMIDSRSFRPGDILTTLSGKTVEILNTDAEGRLILCDILTYVERFDPEIVIDIATLTGACVIALGHHLTGLMSNKHSLANELIIASEQSGDLAWELPLEDKFQEQIESNIADIANIGGSSGGTITAGCFLSRFTNKYQWAHLDIAGTAWSSSYKNFKGATGRPVAMLSQFLINRSCLINEEIEITNNL